VQPAKPAVEISGKYTNEPVVRNLSEVKSETILLIVSSTDILLKELVLLVYLQQENDWGI
jgi:hypothetical protein